MSKNNNSRGKEPALDLVVRKWNEAKEQDKIDAVKPKKGPDIRQIVLLVLIFLVSVYVGIFMVKYSIVEADVWRTAAQNQQLRTQEIKAHRGSIYDTSGVVLAQSYTVWNVIMNPKAILTYVDTYEKDDGEHYNEAEKQQKIDLIVDYLANSFGADRSKLMEKITECRAEPNNDLKLQYYIVEKEVDKDTITAISHFLSDNGIPGNCIEGEESSKRYYPNESLASNVIGFMHADGYGAYGLEAYYDEYLSGTDGKAVYSRNAYGGGLVYATDKYHEAVDGYSLYLTIDEVLQHYLEKNLDLCVSQHKVVNRACGIIMDCNTGGILAMATAPSFNLNDRSTLMSAYDLQRMEELEKSGASDEEINALYIQLREQQWKNKAITELYYPGSVFKSVTTAIAIEEETANLDSTFYCARTENVAGVEINCWATYAHGTLTLQEAITKSCNPCFIQIGQTIGADKFYEYFEAFGFTEPTGIDLPGESDSIHLTRDQMGIVELASSSFGQTNKVTPIQMITAFAAIVNGGYLVTPHVVDKIVDNDGNIVETIQTKVKRQVISEETSATMRKILENVVESNGGSNAYISGYRIGGKSGTTEKIDEYNAAGGSAMGATMDYVPSFAAMAPADDPEIVMLVMADTPTGTQYYGSAVAAPVVSAVFKDGLQHLGIYPTYTAEELAKNVTVPYVLGYNAQRAESAMMAQGFEVVSVGDAETGTVAKQFPYNGTTIPKGSTVYLYYGEETEPKVGVVPDVTGMTVSEANAAIINAGFNIQIAGGAAENSDAVASSQSFIGETYLGTLIEVTFLVMDRTG